VVLVGAPTYGKPYGFVPRNYCGTTYNAVHFETLNAEGVGGYTSGFEPHCAAADDLDRELGDSNEARLKTALFYAKHDRCPAPPPMALAWRKQVRDGEAFGEVNPNVMVRE